MNISGRALPAVDRVQVQGTGPSVILEDFMSWLHTRLSSK